MLQCTSRIPSPSSSRAQVHLGPEWLTRAWSQGMWARPLYPFQSSVLIVVPSRLVPMITSSKVAPSAWSRTSMRSCFDSRPTTPTIGGRSVAKVPRPRRRLARRRGGSAGSGCGMPFFPRVLVHLVRFDHVIVQRVLVQSPPGVLLKSVPQIQEAHAVAVQFAGQLGRRHALGDAAEDGQDLGGTTLGALEDGASEGVEDAPQALHW